MKGIKFLLAFGSIALASYVLVHLIALAESIIMAHFIPGIIVLAIVNIILWGKEIAKCLNF